MGSKYRCRDQDLRLEEDATLHTNLENTLLANDPQGLALAPDLLGTIDIYGCQDLLKQEAITQE